MKKEISKYQYVKILRPHQWLKNLLVFIPILRPNHFDYSSLQSSVIAFIAFCLIASSSYIINDLVDLDSDRRHPRKRKRPFASGSVKITHGIIISFILSVLAIITAAFLGNIFVIIFSSESKSKTRDPSDPYTAHEKFLFPMLCGRHVPSRT